MQKVQNGKSKDRKDQEKKPRRIRAEGTRTQQVLLIKVEAKLRTQEKLVQHFLSSEPRRHWPSWWIGWLTQRKFLFEANGNGLEVQKSNGSALLFKDKGMKQSPVQVRVGSRTFQSQSLKERLMDRKWEGLQGISWKSPLMPNLVLDGLNLARFCT